jgi:P-type E1-E2 ATPase
MTIGIIYAIKKLKAKDIYTISPNQIIDGGVLDTMCFDKTGTLTTDSMDFKSLLVAHNSQFEPTLDIAHYQKPQTPPKHLEVALANMACNHTVVKLESTG